MLSVEEGIDSFRRPEVIRVIFKQAMEAGLRVAPEQVEAFFAATPPVFEALLEGIAARTPPAESVPRSQWGEDLAVQVVVGWLLKDMVPRAAERNKARQAAKDDAADEEKSE